MSLPPLKINHRASLSDSRASHLSLLNLNNLLNHSSQIPIIKIDKHLKPEIQVKKILSKDSVPPIDYIQKTGTRLSPLVQSIHLYENYTKKTYLKKKYVDYIKGQQISEYSNDFTRPIRDYFDVSPRLHKSYIEKYKIKEEKKLERQEKVSHSPERLEYKSNKVELLSHEKNPNKKTNKVVYSQRPVPEAKTSMKKKKVEVSYSRFMNENMQTDWNSFDIEEWELDPDA